MVSAIQEFMLLISLSQIALDWMYVPRIIIREAGRWMRREDFVSVVKGPRSDLTARQAGTRTIKDGIKS